MEENKTEFNPFQFKEYASMENTYRQKEIDRIIEQGKSGGKWRLSEKIHGANFSFWYDGKELKCAKRTAFLDEGSSFFNWQDVRMVEEPKIKKLWEHLKEVEKENWEAYSKYPFKGIVIYGELFGGNYPHPDVPRDYNGMTVQKGVFYSPSNLFYCFDIKINGVYLNEDIKGMLCEKFGIFWDKPIFEGTFQECINYSNEYQTTIPAILGLPEIDGNICEGNVIKPINADWFWCGSRVIFKNKNAKFAENTGKASGQKLMKTDKESVVLSEKGQELFETMLGYVNENRLRNLISKIGKITDKDFGKLMGGCQKDTIEDFLKDYRDEFLALDVKEQKFIPKRIGAEWTTIIRKNFLDIIDNTF